MSITTYGDISPRTAAYAAKDLLSRAIPYLVWEKFAQPKVLPTKSSKAVKFRRYDSLAPALTPLTEGVTPTATQMTFTDVPATVSQYGAIITITDVIMDTHEDPVLQEAITIAAEQAATTIETIRFNVFKAGTSVMYANGAARGDVNTPITIGLIRRATRALKAQNAKPLTTVVRSTPAFGTENIPASYIAICHPDVETDLRSLGTSFIPVEKYGNISPFENEIGSVEGVRFLTSTISARWESAGGVKGLMLGGATNAHVYPVIIIGKDFGGIVPLKGNNAITPTVVNVAPSKSDALGQRGSVGWKTMQTAVILNDLYMQRLEVAVTA